MKKAIIAIGIVFVVAVVGILVIGRTFYPDNVAETAPDGGAKGLKTRYYDKEPAEVLAVAKEEIPNLSTWGSGWKIVDEKTSGAVSELSVEVPVVVFIDDLKVSIEKQNGKTSVNVRSSSRVGKSDFGENARHVRQILEALDRRLK